jgi:uncharacterized protein YdeI (YjbR/CyaY-like superfamily)
MAEMNFNPKVDAYVAKAQPFAQPILGHLRELVHRGCPGVEEEMKWSRPFFVYRGAILGNMSAFKEHCSFGFWGEEIGAMLRETNVLQADGMGSLGKIASLDDLPGDKRMLGWIKQAAEFVESGTHTGPIAARHQVVKAPKVQVPMPEEFAAALFQDKRAATVFAGFSPSCRREYIEWVAEAKRAETRERRIATAVAWIGEGKQRNWKYESCAGGAERT